MARVQPAVRICSDRFGFGAFCLVAVCERLGLCCEVSHASGGGGNLQSANQGLSDVRPAVILSGNAKIQNPVSVGGLRAAINFLFDLHPTEVAEAFPLLASSHSGKRVYWVEKQWIDFVLLKLQPALAGVQHRRVVSLLDTIERRLQAAQDAGEGAEDRAIFFETEDNKNSLSSLLLYATLRFHRWGGVPEDWKLLSALLSRQQKQIEVKAAAAVVPPPPVLPRPLARKLLSTQPREARPFYITTAINYTNGPPHMGHAYEAVVADCVARYHKVRGDDVHFVTGTDEHGLKIATAAAALNKTPLELCDGYVEKFKELIERANVKPDFFIRTTMQSHQEVCRSLWERCKKNGDIFLGKYKGWYMQREETFVSQRDAEAYGFKDPITGKPLEQMEEESYFFRMSKYQDALLKHIRENPDFISPPEKRQEILTRLSEPLQDLSVSRSSFTWGVSVPGDPKHVMYVWFDALTNYYSGNTSFHGRFLLENHSKRAVKAQLIDKFDASCASLPFRCLFGAALQPLNPNSKLIRFWPASVHLIGKDIVWFHCVIWPSILMSAGLPLPQKVFSHGFVLGADGEKMSKSLGNGVDPFDALEKFGADSFRYFLLKEAALGADLRFDTNALILCSDSELANALGNLVHRAAALCGKLCGGILPKPLEEILNDDAGLGEAPPFQLDQILREVDEHFQQLRVREAVETAMQAVRDTNKWLSDRAPWLNPDRLQAQEDIRITFECIYTLAHLLLPFIPNAVEKIFQRLNTPPKTLPELSSWLMNLPAGTAVQLEAEVLFTTHNSVSTEGACKRQLAQSPQDPVQRLDLRVALVEEAELHPLCLKDPKMPPYLLFRLRLHSEQPQLSTAAMKMESAEEVDAARALVVGKRVVVASNIKEPVVKGVNPSHSVIATRLEGRLSFLQPENPRCALGSVVAVETLPPRPRPNDRLKPQQLQDVFLQHLQLQTSRIVFKHGGTSSLALLCSQDANQECGVSALFLQ